MKKTLVISGHPRISYSTANRMILEKLIDVPNITVADIKTNYPDGTINVPYEQLMLRAASLIVLQFPFIWYGIPSHFKAWMETVFAEGFAYGRNGDALKNKKLLLSITLGGNCKAYSENGQHRHAVESFLKPSKCLFRIVVWNACSRYIVMKCLEILPTRLTRWKGKLHNMPTAFYRLYEIRNGVMLHFHRYWALVLNLIIILTKPVALH